MSALPSFSAPDALLPAIAQGAIGVEQRSGDGLGIVGTEQVRAHPGHDDPTEPGRVFSSVVAGGGFRGGVVVGETDAKSETVKDRPVYPCDLIGSMYELLGISPDVGLPHPLGEYVRAVPGPDEGLQMGGRLTEIM